jgi:hypothetical protein
MNLKILMVSVAAMMAVSPAAHAMNFYFSFSNDPAAGGTVAGTVTGEIFDLVNNTTSFPTDVIVDSYPAGITPLPNAPFDIPGYAAQLHSFVTGDGFTVTNGVITGGDYQIYGGNFDLNIQGQYNTLASSDGNTRVQNLSGLDGLTFSLVTPLPSTWTMLIAGFVGLGFFAYRGTKKNFAAIAAV